MFSDIHLLNCFETKIITMPTLSPYLAFDDNCEEAMNFYAQALDGEIVSVNRFAEMPNHPPEIADKIMHCEMRSGKMVIMASDAMPGMTVSKNSGNTTLMIQLEDIDTQTKYFNNLATGGNITMPLEDTFWGARFGMVTDKYGVAWMLNCELQQNA